MKYPLYNSLPKEANYYCNKQSQYAQKEIHLLKIRLEKAGVKRYLVNDGIMSVKQKCDLENQQ